MQLFYSCDQRIVSPRRDCHRPSIWRIWTHTRQIHRLSTRQRGKSPSIFHHFGLYFSLDCFALRRSKSTLFTNKKIFHVFFLRILMWNNFFKCECVFNNKKLRWLKNQKNIVKINFWAHNSRKKLISGKNSRMLLF